MAVFGVLTMDSTSEQSRVMLASFARDASPKLLLRLVLWDDEAKPADRLARSVAVLPRPPYLPWPHLACTTKILQWYNHAVEVYARRVSFIGCMDSDTWIQPSRLAAYLLELRSTLPPDAAAWGGFFEHWERLDTNRTLSPIGFSYGSPGTAVAWKDPDPRMLRSSARERNAASFAMTQGGFGFYSSSAAAALVTYVLSSADLSVLSTPSDNGKRALKRKLPGCNDPSDAVLGWLSANAFTGLRVYAVQAHMLLEYYVTPAWGRFNPVHAIAVHSRKADRRRPEGLHTTVAAFEARVRNASHTLPRFACYPTTWLHARSAGWQTCTNTASCDGRGAPLVTNKLSQVPAPWLPVAARVTCERLCRGRGDARAESFPEEWCALWQPRTASSDRSPGAGEPNRGMISAVAVRVK